MLAAAKLAGADLAIAALALGDLQPASGRGTRIRLELPVGEALLIDESYNANPVSMAAAIALLGQAQPGPRGRRIAVLGDMLELGPDEIDMHRAVARHKGLSAIATIHCVGPRMRALWEALPRGQRGEWVETAAELAPCARQLFDAGDIVLVKGSKGSKVSLVVDGLRKLGQKAAPAEGTE